MEYNWTPEATLHTKEHLIGNKLALQSSRERTEFSTNSVGKTEYLNPNNEIRLVSYTLQKLIQNESKTQMIELNL